MSKVSMYCIVGTTTCCYSTLTVRYLTLGGVQPPRPHVVRVDQQVDAVELVPALVKEHTYNAITSAITHASH